MITTAVHRKGLPSIEMCGFTATEKRATTAETTQENGSLGGDFLAEI
jgi:hypothetical protein